MNVFSKRYAAIYDVIYHDKDYGAEALFAERLFAKYGIEPPATLLDFGCGTGRHCVEFAKRSWNVTGVDRSLEMLAWAHEKSSGTSIDFATELATDKKFQAIVSLFAVLNYLDPISELPGILDRFSGALENNGVAIFEVWNGVAVPFLSEARKSRRVPGPEDEQWLRTTDIQLDWLNQKMDVEFKLFRQPYEEEWFSEIHRMHYWTPRQFIERLDRAGLSVLDIVPAYREDRIRHDDYNILYVCGAKQTT